MDDAAISDMFAGVGPVTVKRMFGGKGIYCQGIIVAVEVDGEILLKADSETAPLFANAGATQWAYEGKKKGKPIAMPYWSIPDSALDNPDEMAVWARRAYEAGLRGSKK